MPVPRQKFLHPKRPGVVSRADDDGIAHLMRNQLEAAQNERAHQNLAQLGVGLYQREQLLVIELDHFA